MNGSTEHLSKRLEIILRVVTQYYMENAKPIGSKMLRERFGLSWSTATIRNEMARLESLSYLTHCHTSSGRIPTAKGIRYFVDHLLKTEEIAEGVKGRIEKSLKDFDGNPVWLLRHVSQALSRFSRNVSLVLIVAGKHKDYMIGGKENFLGQPEFTDSLKLKDLFRVLEEEEVQDLIFRRSLSRSRVDVSIGSSNLAAPYREFFEDLGVVSSSYGMRGRALGTVSVIGPKRMDYRRTIPLVDYMAQSMCQKLALVN